MESPQQPTQQLTETEQKIFDAAHEVFVQRGLDGAKMQEIADRAGINKALLHYYFRSKEKLFETIARAILNRNVPVIRGIIESDLVLETKIERLIAQYIAVVSRNSYLPIFLISEMNKHPDRFFGSIFPQELPRPEVFVRQVNEAVAEGRIRAVDPRHLIVNIMSMCLMPFVAKPMLRVLLGMAPEEWDKFVRQRTREVTEFVFAALRP